MMDERKENVLEVTNEEYRSSFPNYEELIIKIHPKKKELIEVINSIENDSLILYLVKYINKLKEKW